MDDVDNIDLIFSSMAVAKLKDLDIKMTREFVWMIHDIRCLKIYDKELRVVMVVVMMIFVCIWK